MHVKCGKCPAVYAVPDKKVRGRKVKIKCKRCEADIIVDGTKLVDEDAGAKPAAATPAAAKLGSATPRPATAASAAKAPAAAAAAPRPQAPVPRPGGLTPAQPQRERLESSPSRPRQETITGGFGPPPGSAPGAPRPRRRSSVVGALGAPVLGKVRPSSARPAARLDPDEGEWSVAVSEDDRRELDTEQVVELYRSGVIDPHTFVWKSTMDDWSPLGEVAELNLAVKAAGLPAPDLPKLQAYAGDPDSEATVVGRSPLEAPEAHPSGQWREPGRPLGLPKAPGLDDDDDFDGGIGFEDVTVAGRIPEELLNRGLEQASAKDSPPPPAPRVPLPSAPGVDFDEDELTRALAAPDSFTTESDPLLPGDRPSRKPTAMGGPNLAAFNPRESRKPTMAGGITLPSQRPSRKPTQQDDDEPAAPRASQESSAGKTGARHDDSVLFSLSELGDDKKDGAKQDAESAGAFRIGQDAPNLAKEGEAGTSPFETAGPSSSLLDAPSHPSDETSPAMRRDDAEAKAAPAKARGGRGGMYFLVFVLLLIAAAAVVYFVFPQLIPQSVLKHIPEGYRPK